MALLPYFKICPQDLSDPSEPLLCELPSAAVTEAKLVRKGAILEAGEQDGGQYPCLHP